MRINHRETAPERITLATWVRVRQTSIRSISVEQDLDRGAISHDYVVTGQARRSLDRIVSGIESSSPSRAWTLTGQYGTGKSYFGLNLTQLACSELPGHEAANEQMRHVDPLLAERVASAFFSSGAKGMFPVPVTGHRASLHECVRQGLWNALTNSAERTGPVVLSADDPVWREGGDARSVLHAVRSVAEAVTQQSLGYSGLLLILDELGKPLEYVSAHPDTSDIYFLQELAELANRSEASPLLFVGILHQGFDRYAGHLDTLTQREWAKVQGRFEDIPFQEPPSQMLRLMAKAIEHDSGVERNKVLAVGREAAQESVKAGWLPQLMPPQEYLDICEHIYPLHPTAASAIPYIFRRLAQNERSLFAYLVSMEPLGFQELIQNRTTGEFIRIPDLFDYLVANYQARLYSSLRARSLTETLERIQSALGLDDIALDLLKTIGMLNWLAENSPYKATHDSLVCALKSGERTEAVIVEALDRLRRQSLITFRRFNSTYAVWQGSDVDVEGRIEEAHQRLQGQFSPAQAVELYLPPQPIVAKRHSYVGGTVRYFDVRYVDEVTRDRASFVPSSGASGVVFLCLSASSTDAESAVKWATSPQTSAQPNVVVGVVERSARVAELLSELRSMNWVRDNTPELHDDPVARRELRARMSELETLIRNELENTLHVHRLANAAECRWFVAGEEVTRQAERGLSSLISHVCDGLYNASPRIWNEILNRRALSSQGAAARRNLIDGMLKRAEVAGLGIEGFPPERSMYEALLRAGGIHIEIEPGRWQFSAPTESDPLNLRPTWQAISEYIFAPPPEPRALQELFARLKAAPFGVTDGMLPVLLCAFVLANASEVTLYREGSLLPEPEIADWELLLRRPELFALAGCRVIGPRVALVERLARGLGVEPTALTVVRELIRRLKSLPEHTWRTQRMTIETLAVRRAVEQARSPERLLFRELPAALGLEGFGEESLSPEEFDLFFDGLNGALLELSTCTASVVRDARDFLLAACGLATGDSGWESFAALAGEMAPRITNPSLAPLLRRAADAGAPQGVLESALAYVANRPPKSWTDGDVDRFRSQAQALGGLFRAERNGHNPYDGLSAAEQARSQEVTGRLRAFVTEHFDDDPIILQAALRALLNDPTVARERLRPSQGTS